MKIAVRPVFFGRAAPTKPMGAVAPMLLKMSTPMGDYDINAIIFLLCG